MNRIRKLLEKNPAGIEGALALARAALDAKDFKAARAALTPHLQVPTQRVATLMAEIEQAEHGDVGRAREWTARAVRAAPDPAWTADGVVSDKWLPVSPVTGRLDAFQWKVPVAEIGIERPVVDVIAATAEPPPVIEEKKPEPAPQTAEVVADARPQPPAAPPAEPVIPLVHAPDDPGIDAPFESDPSAAPPPDTAPRQDAWQRFRQLFR
jgi:HemY protein